MTVATNTTKMKDQQSNVTKPKKTMQKLSKEKDKLVKINKSALKQTLALIGVDIAKPLTSSQKEHGTKRKNEDFQPKKAKKEKKSVPEIPLQNGCSNATTATNSKSAMSDKKRLESLIKRKKQIEDQKAAMKKALSSSNAGDLNKKVVFDTDSDDETDSSDDSSDEEIPSEPAKGSQRKSLFDDSGSEESDSDEDNKERFRHKKEFEGKSGQKLKSLQKQYCNDTRFKLSQKFLDSDSEDSEENTELSSKKIKKNAAAGESEKNTVQDDELQNALKIANQVLSNKDIWVKSKSQKTFKDMSTIRLDPDKMNHQELIQKPEKKVKKKPETEETAAKSTTEVPVLPVVQDSQYYAVEETLMNAFSSKTERPFSLLATFGDQNIPVEEDDEEEEPASVSQIPLKVPVQDSSSSEEEDEDIDVVSQKLPKTEEAAKPISQDKTFFFTEDDVRLTSGVKHFQRTLDEEELWFKWRKREVEIKKLFKSRQKHIVRRLNYKKDTLFKNRKRN